jgi:hypothetical protein
MGRLSEDHTRQLQQLREMQPIILLGMHRSGTSLTTRLLRDLGIHMGSWLSRDAESVFFQRLNRRILAAADVRWGNVDPLVKAMRSDEFVERQAGAMQQALFTDRHLLKRGVGIARFFGSELWEAVRQGRTVPWGWKDPRTTITFPIWVRVFPNARLVHILRNGIDVAISTHRRSEKQQRKLRNRLFRLDYSPATLEFGYCFRLWETYVSFVLEHKHLVPPEHYLEMRYEDLLKEPHDALQRLLDFAGHSVRQESLVAVCDQINQSRLDNSAFANNYRDAIPSLAESPTMRRLDYGYDLAPTG